jgi:hypothetical protein
MVVFGWRFIWCELITAALIRVTVGLEVLSRIGIVYSSFNITAIRMGIPDFDDLNEQ